MVATFALSFPFPARSNWRKTEEADDVESSEEDLEEELLKKPEDRLLGLLLLLGLLSLLVPIISLESLLSLELKLLKRDLLLDCDFEKLEWLELKSSDLKLELELVDTPDELDLSSLVALEDDVGVKPL